MKAEVSPTQEKVMLWLSQGWTARVAHGTAVEINGERRCNENSLLSLERRGLVERDAQHSSFWKATVEGKKHSPSNTGA